MITNTLSTAYTRLNALTTAFLNIGIDHTVERDEKKYIRFLNVVIGMTALGLTFYISASLCYGNYGLAALQASDMVVVFAALWLNHKGKTSMARIAYLLLLNYFILTTSWYIGHQSSVSDFFYLSSVLPFLLFPIRYYKQIIAGCAMAILSFYIYEHTYLHFVAYNISLEAQQVIYHINTWMKFVMFGKSIYILANYNHISETELAVINNKLSEQAGELKRSNEDLEQFAYIISHDLKAPVRSIASYMKLLQMRNKAILDGPSNEYLELSRSSAERMSRQIEELLSYCKVGRNLPPAGMVDTHAMLQTIQTELSEKIAAAKARVIVTGRLPVLNNLHSNMLHHIFQNLVANGIKFNTNPAPQVTVSYTIDKGMVRFSVTDNGIGIAPGFEKKLFHMFQRLHTTEEFEGTGIGLSVCKKIVDFYKGQIWFESVKGEGTTFHFTLPAHMLVPVVEKTTVEKPYTHAPYTGIDGALLAE